MLPVAATLAVFVMIFPRRGGPVLVHRNDAGYAQPAVNAGLLGILTLVLVPLQIALIVFAMRGFKQGWNVEVEVRPPPARPAAGRLTRAAIVRLALAGVAER